MKCLAFLGVLAILAPASPAQNNLTLEGEVVNSVTGAGISGSSVQVLSGERGSVRIPEVLTNEIGVFRVTGLRVGDYIAYAQKQGYFGTRQIQFNLNGNGNSVRPRLQLVPPATLRGRVLGIDGKPAKASVDLGPSSRTSVHTNDDGYFSFEQLIGGAYTLLARPDPVESVSTHEGSRSDVVPTYYPSSSERTQAESIRLQPGEDLSGFEIRLQSVTVYRVSGVVLDPAGRPVPDASVQLQDGPASAITRFRRSGVFSILSSPVDGNSIPSTTTKSAVTDEDGAFEFPSVRAGSWTFYVESDAVRDEIQQRDAFGFGSATVNVENRDLDDVRIRLALPVDIYGTVDSRDASTEIVRFVEVSLNGENGHFGGSAHPDGNGLLRLEGVIPGRYVISADASSDYYASVLLGSTDVTGQIVELAASYSIRVVLKRGGTLRWNSTNLPDSGSVVLIPQDLKSEGYSAPARTSELAGIPPGQYYAIALDRFIPRPTDVRILREVLSKATSVRIESGSVSFAQLEINHAPD